MRRTFSVVLTCAAVFALVLAAFPFLSPVQWLSQTVPLAQAVAFSRALGIAVIIAAIVLHRFRVAAAVAALAGVVFVLFPGLVPWAPSAESDGAPGGTELRLVSYNAQGALTDAEFAELRDGLRADVIALAEVPGPDLWVRPGLEHTTAGGPEIYREVPTTRIEDGPLIASVHTVAPVPGVMDLWRADQSSLAEWVGGEQSGPVILAGDFNATMRHGPLSAPQRFLDAATECGMWSPGTWPAALPGWLSAPIDRVLVTPDIEVVSCETARVGDSDHRALAVTLRY